MSTSLLMAARNVQKSMTSPMDVCTIVSLFPRDIIETKNTVDPHLYHIPAGSYENPGILHVNAGVTWIDPGADRPHIEQIIPSVVLANSIVKDYANSLIGTVRGAAIGLFFLEGRHSAEDVKKNYKLNLDAAAERQRKWFANLVEIADIGWSQTNGNPKSIPSDSKLAAEYLGLKNKPWMGDFNSLALTPCINCGSLRNPAFPSCPTCGKIVDLELAGKLGLIDSHTKREKVG